MEILKNARFWCQKSMKNHPFFRKTSLNFLIKYLVGFLILKFFCGPIRRILGYVAKKTHHGKGVKKIKENAHNCHFNKTLPHIHGNGDVI